MACILAFLRLSSSSARFLEQRALVQPFFAAVQLANRQKDVRLQLDLVVTYAFPVHASEFALQVLDLTHVQSTRGTCFQIKVYFMRQALTRCQHGAAGSQDPAKGRSFKRTLPVCVLVEGQVR